MPPSYHPETDISTLLSEDELQTYHWKFELADYPCQIWRSLCHQHTEKIQHSAKRKTHKGFATRWYNRKGRIPLWCVISTTFWSTRRPLWLEKVLPSCHRRNSLWHTHSKGESSEDYSVFGCRSCSWCCHKEICYRNLHPAQQHSYPAHLQKAEECEKFHILIRVPIEGPTMMIETIKLLFWTQQFPPVFRRKKHHTCAYNG